MNKKTTLYVDITSDNGAASFDVLTHQGSPDNLADGVERAINLGQTGVAIVDENKADQYASWFNHAPGCSVRGSETH